MPPRRKRPRRRKQPQRFDWRLPLLIGMVGFTILLAVVVLHRRPVSPPTLTATAKRQAAAPRLPAHPSVVADAPKKITLPRPQVQPAPPAKAKQDKPRIALVIDDMGYHDKVGDALLDLRLNLSFAFLPFAPHTQRQLERARHQGRDILLHLPMEATDSKWDPGPGALLTNMSATELRRTEEEDLAAIPGAIGINNHMGSLFTEDEPAMRTFLSLLRPRHLFFLDSQTSPRSVGYRLAREMGIPALRRNVFLDNEQDTKKIKKQLDALILLAKRQGTVIGIAHPHQATLDALREYQRRPDRSVDLVGIHVLVGKE